MQESSDTESGRRMLGQLLAAEDDWVSFYEEDLSLMFVRTVRNGARFEDDGLNGDDEVSTTNDDFC